MQGQQISHYRLTDKLGADTHGEMWRGVYVDDPDFTVTVKLVLPPVREDPAFLSTLRKGRKTRIGLSAPSAGSYRPKAAWTRGSSSVAMPSSVSWKRWKYSVVWTSSIWRSARTSAKNSGALY